MKYIESLREQGILEERSVREKRRDDGNRVWPQVALLVGGIALSIGIATSGKDEARFELPEPGINNGNTSDIDQLLEP